MGEPQDARQPPPQPPPPPLVEPQQTITEYQQSEANQSQLPQQQQKLQPPQQQQQQQLFAGVKFFLAQCNEPERVKQILNEAGAKHINYLSESVTHCIADTNCPEAEEAVELFDKPVVTSTWIHLSLKANTLLPVEAFSPIRSVFKRVVAAFSSHLCLEDVQSLAAVLTFYGASVVKDLNKATHLIVPSASASDLKPDKQLPNRQTLKLVSPDWVLESVKLSCMCDEHLFNPALLLSPKPPPPPTPPPVQPPHPQANLPTPASIKPADNKTAPQLATETLEKKDKTLQHSLAKSEVHEGELKINQNHVKQSTQCQKISHPHNQPSVPQIHSQMPRLRAPSLVPRGMPQHKFRPLLPPSPNVSPNPQSVLQHQHQHQQRPQTLDVQQPKKVTINYGNQYMKPTSYASNLDSQPHTPHPHQYHQNPQHNQIQPQSQLSTQQQQYPVQNPNQIQHVVQHQHPLTNQHQVQLPHQHHHQVQLQYQPQPQQYVQQARSPHIQPNQMQSEHQQQHIHVQTQNPPYQMTQYVPQQESQVTQTQHTYASHRAQPGYQIHEQPQLCQPVPQEIAPMSRPPMRPVQPSYQTHQQIVRPNQVRAPGMQYKTQSDKIHPQQSTYSQFDGGEVVNNVNASQPQTLPSSNVHWQVIPGSPNRMTQPQHQQFLNSPQAPIQQQQQVIRQPIVIRAPLRPQIRPTVASPLDQQFMPRLPPQRFQQTQQKPAYHPHDQDIKPNQANFQERASNTPTQPSHLQPFTPTPQQQRPACPPPNLHENSLIHHPSIFNQTQESSMEKIKARVPQLDIEVEYFGHDPKLNVPQDAPFSGCRFKLIDYCSIDAILRTRWMDSIKEAGGIFEENLDQITHLICESRLTGEYSEALKKGIRCVTIYWISDVLSRNKMTYPWKALHLPIPFDKRDKPLQDQIISLTNIKGRDRREVKEMILKLGAKYTDHFTSSNTIIICGNVGGEKYERALEWCIPIANCRLLSDILLKGDFELSRMLTTAKYQLFNISEPLKICSYQDIRDLMLPWTKPITISESSNITLKNPVNGITSMSTVNSNDDSGIATGSNNSDHDVAMNSDKQACNVANNDIEQSKSIAESESINSKTNDENILEDTINTITPKELPKIKRRSTKPIKILFTHLNSNLMDKLIDCVDKLGLVMANNPIACTHLVVDRISRTPKFICAFSHAEYILSYKWLIESHSANDLLDEKYFLLQDKEGEELYSLNLVYSLMKREKRNGLLFNNIVFFVTPTVVTTVSNVKEMIESAGGIAATRKPPSKIQVDQLRSEGKRLVVVTCEEDFHICSMFDFSDVELVDKEFVISGILRQDIDYESHRIKLKTPSHKPLSQLSAPSPPKKLRFDNSSC